MAKSLKNKDAKFIYEATNVFHEPQWEEFSRLKLGFDDDEIEKLQTKYQGNFPKLKQETVKVWMNKENEENLDKLTALKLEYFFSQSETIFPKQAQEDLDGEKRQDEFMYPLKNGKGIALIISNSFADEGKVGSRKPGCTKDRQYMDYLWRETLGCELVEDKVHCDKTAGEMKVLLEEVATAKNIDYVVVVISTHGGYVPIEEQKIIDQKTEKKAGENQETKLIKYEEILYGNDKSKLQASELQKIFCNKEAQPLRNIPKLLILQYCRGKKLDKGNFKDSTDAGVFLGDHEESYPVDALMPEMSDIITVYATHQEFVALRNKEEGSWMIQYIYDVFRKFYKTKHVTDMLTIVNDQMKNRRGNIGTEEDEDCKAMSIYESSLTKDFYLVNKQTSFKEM
ncbi:caspase-2-like [Styela clava]